MQSYDRIAVLLLQSMGSEKPGDAASVTSAGPADRDVRRAPPVTTMRDIAAAAGVSQSTVSRVLNDVSTRVPIAAETRERVVLAARRLGYRPNPLARGLRGASTMLLGAVVRDFSDPFFAGAIEALAVEAMARGYNVVLGHAHGRARRGDRADGRPRDPALRRDRPARRHAGPAAAARRPARLHRPGRRALAGFEPARVPDGRRRQPARASGPGSSTSSGWATSGSRSSAGGCSATIRERSDAFVEFMPERFGGVRDGYIQHVPNTLAGGEAALRALLELAEPPTALVTSTDLVAVGVLHAAYSRGRDRARRAVGRRLRRHPDRRATRCRP